MSDLNKLIDNGKAVVIFRNNLGSVTAFAVNNDHEDLIMAMEDADGDGHFTDDFSVEAAIKRLSDKVMRVGDYADETDS